MTAKELLSIVRSHGVEALQKGDEVCIQHCLFCGNSRYNLELSAVKGVYHSWCCHAKGSVESLLAKHFGLDESIPIQVDNDSEASTSFETVDFDGFVSASEVPTAMGWLSRRGIYGADVGRYQIKLCVDKENVHYCRISIPVRDYWSGKVLGYTSREYLGRPGAKYLHEIPKNVSVGYRQGGNVHVCVEGIFDGIRTHQAGYDTHILLGSGANTQWIEWCSTLPQDQMVLLLLDGDAVGTKRAQALKNLAATVRDEPLVATLPPDVDPADLGQEVLRKVIEANLP